MQNPWFADRWWRLSAYEVASGRKGDALVGAINDHIAVLEDKAHNYYHDDVQDNVFGSHTRAARRTVEALEREGCVAYAG